MKIQSNCFLLCLVFFLISQSAFADEQSSSNAQTLTEASKNNEISKAKLLYLVDQRKLDENLFEHSFINLLGKPRADLSADDDAGHCPDQRHQIDRGSE